MKNFEVHYIIIGCMFMLLKIVNFISTNRQTIS